MVKQMNSLQSSDLTQELSNRDDRTPGHQIGMFQRVISKLIRTVLSRVSAWFLNARQRAHHMLQQCLKGCNAKETPNGSPQNSRQSCICLFAMSMQRCIARSASWD
eukprot:3008136-Amphidinium_carterae.1